MSCELIEKLQREVDFYKKELHQMNRSHYSSIMDRKAVSNVSGITVNERYRTTSN